MLAFLVAAQLATATPCPSVQPSPAFVCHNGGWLPPGHPLLPQAEPAPAPSPSGEPFGPRFKVGRHYVRGTTDLFIGGTGQLVDGTPVLFAVCQSLGDGCYAVGYVRMLPANATSHDFTELP
jgi:hypothetical protein